ncbi:cytochrome ubiquinol oxidase subunit I [Dissulfurirhabdus thermomarina]|uniref:Cytochrome ubiquinol oxidase subunit I n=1 Tax=Dissulfurirhabdus thermomarina TaxID=1765737 RepID=A0A6N9TL45_DISTH|nr:cytochrome ubiquinol oxidase subunit I [Dissulfurirhabdus thermomarina]NDY41955.1 cytochrome ubiquinol oxidase subunit I [Dissulfurirhabdus thermomarina]NMX22939.1 cytochrome ubiquinol oxidase subunit I [Dissulfurirhabdus thermomarina]
MDALMLSRLQFAAATLFHFLFVPLTLGLSVLVAVMETRYVRTGDEEYRRMARFWGRLFLINFAIGVVTGITLEFQFGTNWSRYSAYVGDIFGSLLAIEATLAFFLESTFIGVWIFGWKRLSPRMHALTMWLVAGASTFSAIWILIANAWMQHPVGYVLRNGRAELADFLAVVTQKFAWVEFLHTVSGAYILSGFFVMGVSAWHLLRRNEVPFFTRSFRIGLVFALVFSIFEVVQGHLNGAEVAEAQPTKLAAMESLWETTEGAPMTLFLVPDEAAGRNAVEIGRLPGFLSLLAYHDPKATVKGLNDFPADERPPVLVSFLSFRIMVGLGLLFVLLTVVGWFKRNDLVDSPTYLRIMVWAIPLPYIAIELGWILAEVGRQPWIVYGLMRTSDAVSPVAASQVAVSLAAFVGVYTGLGILAYYLMARYARRGPEPAPAA